MPSPSSNWFGRLFNRRKVPLRNAPARSRLSLEPLDERIVPTQLLYGLFDTAVGATGALLTGGTDPHYTLSSQVGVGTPAFVTNVTYGTGYIGPSPEPGSFPGTYTYQTTFSIPQGTDLTGATLSGLVSADDDLSAVQIDGAAVATTPATPFTAANARANPFSVNISGLAAGSHTLTFVTQNGGQAGSPTGLKVSDLVLNVKLQTSAPPVLTGSNTPITVITGGSAVLVDPNLTLTSTVTPSVAIVRIGDNFTAGDVLAFTPPAQSGITGSYNAATGTLRVSGTATTLNYQTALRSVTFQTTATLAAPRSVTFAIGSAAYDAADGHFYEYVAAPDINWDAAEAAASGRNLYGLQGYLATDRSAAEDDFIADTTGGALAWIGASDAAQEGVWQWVTGPDAGVQFWQGNAAGTATNGEYVDWFTAEPNGDDFAEIRVDGAWADAAANGTVAGYVIEYGGSVNDPTLNIASATTVNVVARTAAPTVTDPAGGTATTATNYVVQGTAPANSVVNVYTDLNNNGAIDGNDAVVATQTLTNRATAFGIPVPLTVNAANNFLVTANTAGAAAGESAPVDVPTITQNGVVTPNPPVVTTVAGFIFLDANANGFQDVGEHGISGQVVFLDANGDGQRGGGEPSAVTDGSGYYSFTNPSGIPGAVLPLPAFANTDPTPLDGSFATVPISPVVPVFPSPKLYAPASADPNTQYVLALYRAILGREATGKNADGTAEYATYTPLLPDIGVVGEAKHKLARAAVAELIWNSAEHRRLQVDSYYRQFLGRERTDVAASQGHVDDLLRGRGEMNVVLDILGSGEFQNRFATDGARLQFLLANLLGQADPTQTTLHVGGRAVVVNGTPSSLRSIVDSDESVFRQINGMYLAFLQREVEPGGLAVQNARERAGDSPTPVAVDVVANPEFFVKATGKSATKP